MLSYNLIAIFKQAGCTIVLIPLPQINIYKQRENMIRLLGPIHALFLYNITLYVRDPPMATIEHNYSKI